MVAHNIDKGPSSSKKDGEADTLSHIAIVDDGDCTASFITRLKDAADAYALPYTISQCSVVSFKE